MQEKLLTQLQSAYPNKFHHRCIYSKTKKKKKKKKKSTNFVPFHLKETTQSIIQIV